MIHLDTHVAIWLYTKVDQARIPDALRRRLDTEPLAISPAVRLELSFLREIGRLVDAPGLVIADLTRAVGLRIDPTPFSTVTEVAEHLEFTRDPFDRLIAAQAVASGAELATKDRAMRQHLPLAIWD